MSDVTRILSLIESGDQKASEELSPLVYDELRRLADFDFRRRTLVDHNAGRLHAVETTVAGRGQCCPWTSV